MSPAGMLPLILTETDRFSGTEGADEAVLKLKQLETAKAVEVQDADVIRWPQYAAEPTVRQHVTEEGFLAYAQGRAHWSR